MRKLIFILTIYLIFSCEDKKSVEYFNESNAFYYKIRNGLNEPVLKNIVDYFSKDHDLELIEKNDSILVHGIHHTDKDRFGYLGAWVCTKEYFSTKIECQQKVIFNQNEFQYSFCYHDIIEYFDKQIEKSKKDVKYHVYVDRKEKLLTYNHKIDKQLSKNNDEYVISDLIMNIPFSIYDKYQKKEIPQVSATNYQTGLLGSIGYEHFFFGNKKDTIASMPLVYIMH